MNSSSSPASRRSRLGLPLALLAGLVFGLGLIAGGMTDPAKVKGFLDFAGRWDPSLAFVMGGAIAVGLGAFALAVRRRRAGEKAWAGNAYEIPGLTAIDARLIGGGVLFGIGWGLGGYCPGPAIVAAGAGLSSAWLFLIAMVAGMLLHDRLIGPT
ncbi:DUF6691 family protein [Leptothrix sp. BB-4]